ncbi:uncharacterized protein WCC33_019257 [Rhinophrynus dorsalis]
MWLTFRLRVAERERHSAEEANRLFKQEFGDKIESLQLEVDQLRMQRSQCEAELKKGKNKRHSGYHKGSPETKSTTLGNKELFQRNKVKMDAPQHKEMEESVRSLGAHQPNSVSDTNDFLLSKAKKVVSQKTGVSQFSQPGKERVNEDDNPQAMRQSQNPTAEGRESESREQESLS